MPAGVLDQATLGSTVADLIAGSPKAQVSMFVDAAKAAGLYDAITGPGFAGTLWIPTDAAFNAALTELATTMTDLVAHKDLLAAIINYHASAKLYYQTSDLASGAPVATLLPGHVLKPTVAGERAAAALHTYG